MNKKGLSNILGIIVAFALIAVSYFFVSLLIFEGGEQYLITPTADIGKDIISENTVPSVNSSVSASIDQLATNYSAFSFPYDLFFFMMWIALFVTSIWLAFQANKTGIFEFFGMLFVGTLLLLLITSYVSEFTSWFLSEIFNKVFADANVSMPIFLFYLNNLGIINFIWWIVLLLVNTIDRSFISRTGQVEE